MLIALLCRFAQILEELAAWASNEGVARYPPANSANRSLLPNFVGKELSIRNAEHLPEVDSPPVSFSSRTSTGSSDGEGGGRGEQMPWYVAGNSPVLDQTAGTARTFVDEGML